MNISFIFKNSGKKDFLKLPLLVQERILEKLTALKTHEDIFSILVRLNNFEPATHRLRVGQYRIILQLTRYEAEFIEFRILSVGHRKDIYR